MSTTDMQVEKDGERGARYMAMLDDAVRQQMYDEIRAIPGSGWRTKHVMDGQIDFALVKLSKGERHFGSDEVVDLKDAAMELVKEDIAQRNQRTVEKSGGVEKFEGPALNRGL